MEIKFVFAKDFNLSEFKQSVESNVAYYVLPDYKHSYSEQELRKLHAEIDRIIKTAKMNNISCAGMRTGRIYSLTPTDSFNVYQDYIETFSRYGINPILKRINKLYLWGNYFYDSDKRIKTLGSHTPREIDKVVFEEDKSEDFIHPVFAPKIAPDSVFTDYNVEVNLVNAYPKQQAPNTLYFATLEEIECDKKELETVLKELLSRSSFAPSDNSLRSFKHASASKHLRFNAQQKDFLLSNDVSVIYTIDHIIPDTFCVEFANHRKFNITNFDTAKAIPKNSTWVSKNNRYAEVLFCTNIHDSDIQVIFREDAALMLSLPMAKFLRQYRRIINL